jgi:hypothetical protein
LCSVDRRHALDPKSSAIGVVVTESLDGLATKGEGNSVAFEARV